MNKETMTLREALSTKKLLDKQINFTSQQKFIEVISSSTEIINGLPISEYEEKTKEKWQSLADMIKRRNAIETAIMNANVNTTISVPKFVSFDTLSTIDTDGDIELISMANAIARKKYYNETLRHIVMNFINLVNNKSKEYSKSEEKMKELIQDQLSREFSTATNVSSKQRAERQTLLEEKMKIIYLDPSKITKRVGDILMNIDSYVSSIDSKLGHATEITTIEFEY